MKALVLMFCFESHRGSTLSLCIADPIIYRQFINKLKSKLFCYEASDMDYVASPGHKYHQFSYFPTVRILV